MKLVQWLARGFHGARIVEAGEQVMCEDSLVLGPHMLDVATGLRGGQSLPPVAPPFIGAPSPPSPGIPHILDLMAQMGAAHPRAIAPDGRMLTFNSVHGGYDYETPPEPRPQQVPSNVVTLPDAPPIPQDVSLSVASAPEAAPAAPTKPPANDAAPAADTAPSEAEPTDAHDTPEAAAARQGAAIGETTGEVGDGHTTPTPEPST